MTVKKLNPPHQASRRLEMPGFKVVHGQKRFWGSVSEAKAQWVRSSICGGVGLLLGAWICSFLFISGVLYNRNQISIKIQTESDLKFRFEFTNSLTQRHTDLSRWWLTVLPNVKHMLNFFFFAKSSPGGFCLQHWNIHSGVMNRIAWEDYCWLCHCCSVQLLWCLRS